MQSPDQVIDIVAAVPEFALTGRLFAIDHLEGINARNIGNAGQDTFAVLVAQTPLDAVFVKQRGVDFVVPDTDIQVAFCFGFNFCVVCHDCLLLSLSQVLFFDEVGRMCQFPARASSASSSAQRCAEMAEVFSCRS